MSIDPRQVSGLSKLMQQPQSSYDDTDIKNKISNIENLVNDKDSLVQDTLSNHGNRISSLEQFRLTQEASNRSIQERIEQIIVEGGGSGSDSTSTSYPRLTVSSVNTINYDQEASVTMVPNDSGSEVSISFNIPRGIPGKDGTNGKDGVDGKDGINGKDGENGKDGKDADPVDIMKIEEDISSLNSKVTALESSVSGNESNISSIQSTLTTLQSNSTALQDNFTTLSNDVSSLKSTQESQSSKVTNLESIVHDSKSIGIFSVSESEPTEEGTIWFDTQNMRVLMKKNGEWAPFVFGSSVVTTDNKKRFSVMKDMLYAMTQVTQDSGKEGTEILDVGVAACSSFENTEAVTNKLLRKLDEYKSAGKRPSVFLLETCGIDLENEDTGSIFGSDCGGSTSYNEETIVQEDTSKTPTYPTNTLTLRDSSFPDGSYVMNYTSTVGANILVPPASELSDSRQNVIKFITTWYIDAALNMIYQAYGLRLDAEYNNLCKLVLKNDSGNNLTFGNQGNPIKYIVVQFDDSPHSPETTDDSTLAKCSWGWGVDDLKAQYMNVTINHKFYDSIDTSNPNGLSLSYPEVVYLDRCIVHELVHGVMATSIQKLTANKITATNSSGTTVTLINKVFPLWFQEGTAELIHGIDDDRKVNIEQVVESRERLVSALSDSNTGYKSSGDPYSAGYVWLRFLIKQVLDGEDGKNE